MRAYLKNYRQSPRKVRLVGDVVRGKSVSRARLILNTLPKRAAGQLKKLLDSAVANARHNDKAEEASLSIKELRVDEGATLHRVMPRAQGRATRINKRTSNVTLVLTENSQNQESEIKNQVSDARKKETQTHS